MGEQIKIEDVSSVIAKLSNSDKCNLGYFLKKKKIGSGFKFQLSQANFDVISSATGEAQSRLFSWNRPFRS
jgi:hypothetical protein